MESDDINKVSGEELIEIIKRSKNVLRNFEVTTQVNLSKCDFSTNKFRFYNCHFQDLFCENSEIQIEFKECRFSGEVFLDNSTIKYLYIKECKFHRIISLDNVHVLDSIEIRESELNGHLEARDIILKKYSIFKIEEFKMKGSIDIQPSIAENNSTVIISKSIIELLKFSQTNYHKLLILDSTIEKKAYLLNLKASNLLKISNSVFKGDLNLGHSKLGKLLIDGLRCEGVFDLTGIKANLVSIDNSTFNKESYMHFIGVGGRIQMFSCNFNSAVFLNGIGNKDILKHQPELALSSTTFSKQFFLNQSYIKSLKIMGCIFNDASFLDSTIHNGDRETFRAIKNIYLGANDSLEALRYHAREMEELWKLTKPRWKKVYFARYNKLPRWTWKLVQPTERWFHRIRNLFKWLWKDFSNWVVLFLNRYSNYYGLKWSRGIYFTLAVAAIFFSLKMSALGYEFDLNGASFYLTNLLNFLYPLREVSMDNGDLKFWVVLWDLLGRIFITYGIYQTATAYRKR
jgi:hypothetical protein